MGFQSMEEADANRWQAAIATCVDCSFGTLFKVDEAVMSGTGFTGKLWSLILRANPKWPWQRQKKP